MRFLLIVTATLAVFGLTISGIQSGPTDEASAWNWLSRLLVVLIIVIVALSFRKRPGNRSVSD